jgi:hypothetical protein
MKAEHVKALRGLARQVQNTGYNIKSNADAAAAACGVVRDAFEELGNRLNAAIDMVERTQAPEPASEPTDSHFSYPSPEVRTTTAQAISHWLGGRVSVAQVLNLNSDPQLRALWLTLFHGDELTPEQNRRLGLSD